ncbi:MAG: NADH kinase pos5 [Peltula sp. TS41687]|nr:MAG: NADH kinase pos5 [Peltula sp. TS41687]
MLFQSGPGDLLALDWPSPPRNVLLVKKKGLPSITESLIVFAKHIKSSYPSISVLVEPHVASEIHEKCDFPIFTTHGSRHEEVPCFHRKVDIATTLGGDGTILHASSLFATSPTVPPILSFSMGTLGFLSEWKFEEYKRAFREIYMSGAGAGDRGHILEVTEEPRLDGSKEATVHGGGASGMTGWSSIRGQCMGSSRAAHVLLRSRLKVKIIDASGRRMDENDANGSNVHAMNDVVIHRGKDPHLAIVEVYVGGRFLTEAVGDGMIISTPTGSTAYSLSSGGSIIHPLVSSLLLTPICPRSLSFRPLVLPANTQVTLRLSEKNRGAEAEVSIDGCRQGQGIGVGMEVQVLGEDIRSQDGKWYGGVPCVMRPNIGSEADGDDRWVGGLNGLLKFNYPFGEDG